MMEFCSALQLSVNKHKRKIVGSRKVFEYDFSKFSFQKKDIGKCH